MRDHLKRSFPSQWRLARQLQIANTLPDELQAMEEARVVAQQAHALEVLTGVPSAAHRWVKRVRPAAATVPLSHSQWVHTAASILQLKRQDRMVHGW